MRDIDDYARKYIMEGFEDYQVYYRRKKIIEILNQYNPNRILEIGCGKEPMFKYWGENKTWLIYEPADEFYKAAIELAANRVKVKIVKEVFPPSKWAQGSVDFILCSSLLHEVENSHIMLNGIWNVCNKDTIVHLNVPNAHSIHRILAKESGLIDDVCDFSDRNLILQQNRVYDMESLILEIEDAGFQVLDKGSYFVKFFSHKQMWKLLKDEIIDERILDGMYKLTDYMPRYGSEIFVNFKKK